MRNSLLRFSTATVCKRGNRFFSVMQQDLPRQKVLHVQKFCFVKFTDKRFYATLNRVELNHNKGFVEVYSTDGSCEYYPWVWLRDNCQCPSCFNPQLYSRTINWKYFDVSVKPITTSINEGKVYIEWSDDHKSHFEMEWLKKRSFDPQNREKWLKTTYRLPKVPWTSAEFPHILKKFKFDDIIHSDIVLLEWLENLAIHGVTIITDTPRREDQIRLVADRVAFIKKTYYGEEFEVRNKPDTTNIAYLSTPLQMHSDLPYYEYKPGVNLLHCLVQTVGEGGENELVDILNVSNKLKQDKPEEYKILTNTLVDWVDIGQEKGKKFYSLYRSPVICLDHNGEFIRVNYSQQQRDSHLSVPLEDVIPWYKAKAVFTEAIYHPDNIVKFKTNEGDILTFDNRRMLHGRTGYNDTAGNERHLIGAYLDWDLIYSQIRQLQVTLKRSVPFYG